MTNGAGYVTFSSGANRNYATSIDGVSISFERTYSGSATGATLNTNTGAITWANNKSTSARSITVTSELTITCTHIDAYSSGGIIKSNILKGTSTCSQSAGVLSYSNITFNSLSYGAVSAVGGSSSPSISYTQTYG